MSGGFEGGGVVGAALGGLGGGADVGGDVEGGALEALVGDGGEGEGDLLAGEQGA